MVAKHTSLQSVWVVIPTFNRVADLMACLDSLQATGIAPGRMVVVDNASTDETVARLGSQFPQVQLVALDENRGATGASNAGFERALSQGAQWVLRLDSDTVVAPDFLIKLIEAVEAYPQVGVASPKIYYADPPDEIWYAGADAMPLTFGARGHRHEKDAPDNSRLREVDYIWAAAMLIKREVLLATRGFDTDFFVYFEEVDFCERVRKLGYRLLFVPDSFVWHKVGSSANSAWTAYHWNCSKMLLYRKHAKNGFHRIFLTVYALVYILVDAVRRGSGLRSFSGNRGPLKDALRGWWAGLREKLDRGGLP